MKLKSIVGLIIGLAIIGWIAASVDHKRLISQITELVMPKTELTPVEKCIKKMLDTGLAEYVSEAQEKCSNPEQGPLIR